MRHLVKTHYDLVRKYRPKLLEHVRARVAATEPREYCRTTPDLVDDGVTRFLMSIFVDWASLVLKDKGYPVRRMTPGEIIGCVPADASETMWANLQQEYTASYNFITHGEKVFFFAESLVQRLAQTELNVDVDLLRLPFPCCMFVFDDDVTRKALYALWGRSPPNDAPITVYMNQFVEGSRRTLGIQTIHGTVEATATMLMRSLNLAEGTRVEDALRTEWSEHYAHEPAPEGIERSETDAAFYGPGLRFFRILANAVLYLNSSHPDLGDIIPAPKIVVEGKRPKHERERVAREVAASSVLSYIPVGARLEPMDASLADDLPGHGGRSLSHRFKVQGHWRDQAHGPRHTLRRLIYVEPFWKGPDAAEVLNRPYVVR